MIATVDSRVVVPSGKRLDLTNGDWVLVKAKLNAGETLDLFERAAPDLDLTAGMAALQHLSPMKTGLALISAYLLDWSLVDPQGAPLTVLHTTAAEKEAIVRSLDFDTLTELITVVTDHDASTRQEKKRRSGSSASATRSPLPAAAGGDSNG